MSRTFSKVRHYARKGGGTTGCAIREVHKTPFKYITVGISGAVKMTLLFGKTLEAGLDFGGPSACMRLFGRVIRDSGDRHETEGTMSSASPSQQPCPRPRPIPHGHLCPTNQHRHWDLCHCLTVISRSSRIRT